EGWDSGGAFRFVAAFEQHSPTGDVTFHDVGIPSDPNGRTGGRRQLALEPERIVHHGLRTQSDNGQVFTELHDLHRIRQSRPLRIRVVQVDRAESELQRSV